MTSQLIAIDKRIVAAMALQAKGVDGAQDLIDRLFAERERIS